MYFFFFYETCIRKNCICLESFQICITNTYNGCVLSQSSTVMVLTAELLLGICLNQTMKVKFLLLLKLYILYTILCTHPIKPHNSEIPIQTALTENKTKFQLTEITFQTACYRLLALLPQAFQKLSYIYICIQSKTIHLGARIQIPACVELRAKNFASYGSQNVLSRWGRAGGRDAAADARVASQLVEIISSLIASRAGGCMFSPLRRFVSSRLPRSVSPRAQQSAFLLSERVSSHHILSFREAYRCELASLSSFDPRGSED